MDFRSASTGILLVLGQATGAFTQEARLSYQLSAGQTCSLDIEIEQDTRSESVNSEDINLYSHMKVEFLVESVDPNGVISLKAHYRDLVLSLLAPGMDVDFHSGSGKNPVLSLLMDTLQARDFQVQMRNSGELIRVEGLDGIFRELAGYPDPDSQKMEVILRTLDEAYGLNAFKSQFNLFISIYPSVQPISNWTRDFIYYFNSKPVRVENRYYLSKTTAEGSIIQGIGMIHSVSEVTEQASLGQVRSAVSGSQTYDYQLDRESGWLRQCLSRQRILIETTIVSSPHLPSGLKIPSYTETVFEVKGSLTDRHEP